MQLKWRFRQIDSSLTVSLSLETSHNIFFLYAVSAKPSGSHAKSEKNTCFCHAPTAVETVENMAALNVDYIACIITVLGTINSNHTFIFDLNYLLWKLKTSKRQVVSFLLETKHKVFRLKRSQFLECQSKTLKVASKFLLPMLNFQLHLRPAGRNFGAPQNMGESLFSSFGVLGGLRGLCFQDTLHKGVYRFFGPIFTFCGIELTFARLTCFDMKSIVL